MKLCHAKVNVFLVLHCKACTNVYSVSTLVTHLRGERSVQVYDPTNVRSKDATLRRACAKFCCHKANRTSHISMRPCPEISMYGLCAVAGCISMLPLRLLSCLVHSCVKTECHDCMPIVSGCPDSSVYRQSLGVPLAARALSRRAALTYIAPCC